MYFVDRLRVTASQTELPINTTGTFVQSGDVTDQSRTIRYFWFTGPAQIAVCSLVPKPNHSVTKTEGRFGSSYSLSVGKARIEILIVNMTTVDDSKGKRMVLLH